MRKKLGPCGEAALVGRRLSASDYGNSETSEFHEMQLGLYLQVTMAEFIFMQGYYYSKLLLTNEDFFKV